MKQVSPQISLKRNPIERAALLRNQEGVERFQSCSLWAAVAPTLLNTRGNESARRKQEDLEYIIN